ncbi:MULTISPECIES: DeoR/GlpR family DNA-binding transcription regulator [Vibrio]|uniref:DeoR/GlpR family DNA-binding transcription regulator n=1 Tax=Vibrio TaxID=662 RepID=UPI000BFFF2CC|nr:DeoR/GlpR family DNA-binding transcription regulator [Vibrio sp. PID17_43]PHJ41634.1 hypothetical protein AK965_10290 [Vibrio sp. PID17_43]
MKTSIERRMEIVNLVGLKGKVHVDELAKEFNVTGATIRGDLRFLEDNGYIARDHGFALVNKSIISQLSKHKKYRTEDEKQEVQCSDNPCLAEIILSEVNENDTIFINSSKFICDSLKTIKEFKQNTIVTRDLNLVSNLEHIKDSCFYLTGGKVNLARMDLSGTKVLNDINQYRFNVSFIHIDGISNNFGVLSNDEFNVDLIRGLSRISEKIVVVARTKAFESNCPFWVCEISDVDVLITDKKLSNDKLNHLTNVRVKVINL